MKRRLSIILILVCLSSASSNAGNAGDIEFDPGVALPKDLLELMFRPISQKFVPNLLKQFSARVSSDGQTDFLDANGTPISRLSILSELNPEKTRRRIFFGFEKVGVDGFYIDLFTRGDSLIDYPLTKVRDGCLPVYPENRQEQFTEIKIGAFGAINFRWTIAQWDSDENHFVLARGFNSSGEKVVEFSDVAGPGFREVTYLLNGFDLGIRKIKSPEMILGIETYTLNSRAASATDFHTFLNQVFLPVAAGFFHFD